MTADLPALVGDVLKDGKPQEPFQASDEQIAIDRARLESRLAQTPQTQEDPK